MPEITPIVRPVTDSELEPCIRLLNHAFLDEFTDADLEVIRSLWEVPRTHGIFDTDGSLLGCGTIISKDMTLPGVGPVPVAAVSGVGVAPDQRRRGLLTALMRTQLHGLHDNGREPIAALHASEGAIYGRFGYGLASYHVTHSVARGVAFRPGVETGNARIRELPRGKAMPLMRELHAKAAADAVGWVSRSEATWDRLYFDEASGRDGAGPYHFAMHPEGYASYRPKVGWGVRGPRYELRVREIVALTPQACAALWRYLLDMDLAIEVVHHIAAADAPLPHLLVNPDLVETRVENGLWVRLVDLDRALPTRRYSATLDTVLGVADAFCPWNSGRWRLRVDEAGTATVTRCADAPRLELDVADLGAIFLGGTRLSVLAAAQRVRERAPGTVAAVDRAFATERAPHCPEIF
ncbi:UPF0256 protein [Longimycelium tulufanense]|uniref:UPF0256 protein n=1 Tax=Longimycelium tulufanense TaxID=907463 RepID=A0A8J3FUX7_9PSEU|nr:GNAT family N-acetyltransferase [Longimycelium tulufanense]GGM53738.1 UPF0256 protein [Longimycelium tulufanense]